MFGRAGVGGGDAGAGFERGSAASATSSTRSSVAPRPAARRDAAGRQPGSDLRYDLRITFEESIRGTEKEIEFRGPAAAATRARGSGAKAGTETATCPQCDGPRRGPQSVRQTMLGQMVNVTACPRCRGEGKIVETPCETCRGDGRTERTRTLRVTIPPGIDEGHQIRLSSEGEVGPRGGPAGSLYVAVHVAAAPDAQARGHRAVSTRRTSRSPRRRSGRGSRCRPSTATRRSRSSPGTQPGTEIRLRGKGVPHLRRSGSRGDLHVLVERRRADASCRRSSASCSRRTRSEVRRDTSAAAAGCSTSSGSGDRPTGSAAVREAPGSSSRSSADVEAVEAVERDPRPRRDRRDERRAGVRPRRRGTRGRGRPDAAGGGPRLPAGPRRGRRPRAAARDRSEALGHLQAFGLRPIGELRTRIVQRGGLGHAWKAHFPVLRVGRRIVIRPTWRRHRRGPDDVGHRARSGDGLRDRAPPDDAAVPGGARAAGGPRSDSRGARDGGPARVLDVGLRLRDPRDRGRPARAPRGRSASTPTRSRSRRRSANARRNRLVRGSARARGACPSGDRPVRRRAREPDRVRARARSPTASRASCAPGGVTRRVGDLRSTARPMSGRRSSGAGLVVDRAIAPRATGSRWRRPGLTALIRTRRLPSAASTLQSVAMLASLFPIILRRTSSSPSRCSCRRSCCRSLSASGAPRYDLRARRRARVALGAGPRNRADRRRLAVTGLLMVAMLGTQLFAQPWLLLALTIYSVEPRPRLLRPASQPAPARRDHVRPGTMRSGSDGRDASGTCPMPWPDSWGRSRS